MRIYVHDSEGMRVVEAESAEKLVDVISAEGDVELWAEDAAEPLAADATLAVLIELDAVAIHVGTGKGKITVSVTYNGETKSDTFGPGTKVDKVLDWATGSHGFKIPKGDRDDLVLRLKGSAAPLDPDTHIGTLASKGATLALDLVAGDKFAG
ncbi:hypothetical protein BH09ACT10_BH09ACT10_16800 [soil metagenome]